MIKHNYHGHTSYCNHSVYTPEELIQRAIKFGLETMGVSEHIHLKSEVGKYRLKNEDVFKEYVLEMKRLKEKYKDQIKILIGLESEITDPNNGELLTEWINKHADMDDIDYIILGHHTYVDGSHVFMDVPNSDLLNTYVEHFIEAVSNTKILYVGHPDGFLKGAGKWSDELRVAARKMIRAAVANNKPLGLNINGFSYGLDFCYPNLEYFQIAAEEGADIILELDAHNEIPFMEENIEKAFKIAEEAGVKIIEKLI